MERISGSPGRPLVVVDFAHTPDALKKALTTLRDHCTARVWCVFGCGGDRDPGKRAPMGAVAASLADKVVITDDNPRTEDPDVIASQIAAGAPDSARVEIVQDRSAAIQHAIQSASGDDVVLIAGKGHEQFQLAGGTAIAFSDAAIARAALGFRQ
jgi:UDP-N-acetylmuramoyl-L-alanyl-D-glutamate--2,6-diaminopimelate ligase